MPIFTPGRRWQPPYDPFKKVSLGKKLLASTEKMIKGPLFGCRMCGNCMLQETAYICPMECPKGVRNGPCGGSTEICCVDDKRPCIWYAIYDRSEKMGTSEKLLEVLPPLDWDKVGTETWGDVVRQVKKVGVRKVVKGLATRNVNERARTWDSIFRPVRQPVWWSGDSEYHAPKYTEPASELERRLRNGEFVVTAEVAPSLSPNTTKFLGNVESVRDYVTAVNFTDNASAMPRVSSWASAMLALQKHAEPVMQVTARDHTRLSVQSDVLGASALGIRNILCLSGDSPREGAQPMARLDILDIDSIQILWMLRRLRDEGKYLDGREIKQLPKYFLGAAGSPMTSEPRFQAIREHKKINAGAQFIQTNVVYDTDRLEIWFNELAKRNIIDKAYLLIGVMPIKSLKMAHKLAEVPGIVMPASIIKRMEAAGDGAEEEGIKIALEIIEHVRAKKAASGIHLMTVGWESIIPRIVTDAGLKRAPEEVRAVA